MMEVRAKCEDEIHARADGSYFKVFLPSGESLLNGCP